MTERETASANSMDILSAEAVFSHLPDSFEGEVFIREVTSSTNEDAKALVRSATHGTTIIANAQTAARGRMGRDFFSPEGGVYLSMILNVTSDAFLVTSAVAVAVCRAIEAVSDLRPQIKWVNDILVEGKKVCGILCEAVPSFTGGIEAVVVGIGINYCGTRFPEELKNTAGCLFSKPPVSRNEFAAEVMKQVLAVVADMKSREYVAEYRKRSAVLGCDIQYRENGVWYDAHAVEVDENCGLIVVAGGEQKTLVSGEISLRVTGCGTFL